MNSSCTCRSGAWRKLGVLAIAVISPAQAGADVVLNIKTYVSSDGEYELVVDPGKMDGAGQGAHRLTRRGEQVWAKELRYTLWDAVVTNDGVVAGYGYSEGYDGRGRESTLPVVILDVNGEERLCDRRPREHSGILSTPPSPYAPLIDAIFVDEERDRFIVQTEVYGREPHATWWRYRLSTGERLDDITPDQPERGEYGFHRGINALRIPKTPLILQQWYCYSAGARFAVWDESGKEIWSLQIDGEYAGLGEDFNWYDMKEQGIVQIVGHEKAFDVLSYKQGERIRLGVNDDPKRPGRFVIVETGREPVELAVPHTGEAPEPPSYPEIALVSAGEIELETSSDHDRPIKNVIDFAINNDGRLGAIVRRGDAFHVVIVDAEGTIVLDQPCKLGERGHVGAFSVTGSGRWVLIESSWEEGAQSRAFFLNVDDGSFQPIEGIEIGRAEAMAPRTGGGFFVHARERLTYTMQDDVQCFDEEGKLLWNMRTPGYGRGMIIQDIAPLPNGGLAVLTSVQDTIEVFDQSGQHQKSIAIAPMLGTRPNYVAGLKADAEGGLILHDFHGSPPIRRIASDGTLRASLTPKFEDDRTFRIVGDVQCAPDGRLWTSDGNALLRLTNDGVVDRILGAKPTDNDLDEIADLAVDWRGTIYALNTRTATVHVFNADGTLRRLLKPNPTDFDTPESAGPIALGGGGYVYVGRNSDGGMAYLEFDPDGERQDFMDIGFDSVTERWLFRPGTMERWVTGYESAALVDGAGKVSRVIARRPDNMWLERIKAAAVAPDGSLAIVSHRSGMRWLFGSTENWLSLYAPTGEGLTTVRAPAPMTGEIAWTGRFIALMSTEHLLLVFDVSTATWSQMTLPEEQWWRILASPDARELWLWTPDSPKITRLRLPGHDE